MLLWAPIVKIYWHIKDSLMTSSCRKNFARNCRENPKLLSKPCLVSELMSYYCHFLTMADSQLPTLDNYHSLVALDTSHHKSATVFGYPSWVYKATSSKNGNLYCLRRLEGMYDACT
jgi:hypothetical protein